jgi:hypothetical protein
VIFLNLSGESLNMSNKSLKTNTYILTPTKKGEVFKGTRQTIYQSSLKVVQTNDASNDTLYGDLEARYGCGFAQWLIDDLNKQKN